MPTLSDKAAFLGINVDKKGTSKKGALRVKHDYDDSKMPTTPSGRLVISLKASSHSNGDLAPQYTVSQHRLATVAVFNS